MLDNYQFSLWKNTRHTTNGTTISLQQYVENIRNGYWKTLIDKLRNETDEENQSKIKLFKLPCITGSGIFKHRSIKGIESHNGLIVIDFDYLNDVDGTFEKLKNDKYTFVIHKSSRGNGFAVFVKIDKEKHLVSYLGLEAYYRNTYNLQTDKSCKNLDRLRYISYDPNIYLNTNAIQFNQYELAEISKSPIKKSKEQQKKYLNTQEWALNKMQSMLLDAPKGTRYHTIYKVGYWAGGLISGGFLSETTVLNELEHIINGMYSTEGDIRIKPAKQNLINGIDNGKLSPLQESIKLGRNNIINETNITYHTERTEVEIEEIKSLYLEIIKLIRAGSEPDEAKLKPLISKIELSEALQIAKKLRVKLADEFGIDNKPTSERTRFFLQKNYDIEYNEITHVVTIFRKDTGEEINIETLEQDLLDNYFKVSIDLLKRILRSNYIKRINPIKNYFENLSEWNPNDEDYITSLASFITLTNENEFELFATMLKKMLVRCIKCGYNEDANRYVFIFFSERKNLGKSILIRKLNPFPDDEYYTQSRLDGEKDSQIALGENFIWNLDELKGIDRMAYVDFKSTISAFVVKERRPYAQNVQKIYRIANFFGSTNNEGFIEEDDDNRWIVFDIADIDFEGYEKHIDFNKVWAQAYYLYKTGYDSEITGEEKKQIAEINQRFASSVSEFELVAKHIKPSNGRYWYTSTEIMLALQEQYKSLKASKVMIGRALSKMKLKKETKYKNGTRIGCYPVELIGFNDWITQNYSGKVDGE